MADLDKIYPLVSEAQAVARAIRNFDEGGMIISFAVGSGSGEASMTSGPISIATVGWSYPPAMVEGIKALLRARQAALASELAQLGVTGG